MASAVGYSSSIPVFEYVLSDKYTPSINTWGLCVAGSNCAAYNVADRPDLKLIVGCDGSFGLYSRRSEDAITLKISAGSPGTILRVDPMTGRPPGAAVRREVEADSPFRRNRIAVADAFRLATLDGYADRDRRYLRRDAGVHSEAAHQWMHVVDTFFPGNPLIRHSQPPDGFAEIFEEDPAPVPEPEDDPDLSVRFDVVIDPPSPKLEPEKKEGRQPTRFELIEF